MNTKMLGWCVAAIAIAALVAMLLSSKTKNPKEGEGTTPVVEEPQMDGARPPEKKETPPEETVMGSSVTAPDVKGLPSEPQKMKGLCELTGRGAYAENGVEVTCDFYYVTDVAYESHVRERSVTPAGEVRVVESRRYEQCSDRITYGDFDVNLALDTLPIHQVTPYVAGVGELVGAYCGLPPGEATVMVEAGVKKILSIDGLSVRKTLSRIAGLFGTEVPDGATAWIERLAKPKIERLHAQVKKAVQNISGKEYLVTYYQNAAGQPLRVKFERMDKKPLSMEEYRILREVNVFLCCRVMPTETPAVGATWKVQVGDLPGVFDSLSGGNKISGELQATRLPDDPDGSRNVDLKGGRVAVLDDKGMESGSFMIDNGLALVSPSGDTIRAFEMLGTGKLRLEEAQKRFLLFKFLKRTDGDSQVRITLTSENVKK